MEYTFTLKYIKINYEDVTFLGRCIFITKAPLKQAKEVNFSPVQQPKILALHTRPKAKS
jgi:hypothetical protein